MMNKVYRSEAMAAIHETMESLHDIGTIGKKIMRKFDEACLTSIRDFKNVEREILKSGFYKDGYGDSKKLPSSEFDQYYIFRAIRKRCRKANKNITLISRGAEASDE
jgi:hypothetical protein